MRRWRQATVWLHVLTSVSWMAQVMTLCLLLSVGLVADGAPTRDAAVAMALAVDGRLVGPMADASAFTGIMLAAATPWGFFVHRWVLVKFLITLVQLHLGIFLLSPALHEAATRGPGPAQVGGSALMAGAIAFQGWLSVTKPWATVRRGRLSSRATAPRWVFVAAVLGTATDLVIAWLVGHPLPLLSLVLLTVVLVRRRRSTGWVADNWVVSGA
jgi:hypothetical protein